MASQTLPGTELQTGDIIHSNVGWMYRVRGDGRYDSFADWTEQGGSPVVDADAIAWPVALMVRDGKPANTEPENRMSVRLAMMLNRNR